MTSGSMESGKKVGVGDVIINTASESETEIDKIMTAIEV